MGAPRGASCRVRRSLCAHDRALHRSVSEASGSRQWARLPQVRGTIDGDRALPAMRRRRPPAGARAPSWGTLLDPAPRSGHPHPQYLRAGFATASEAISKPKFTSKYLIQHVSSKLIPAVKVNIRSRGKRRMDAHVLMRARTPVRLVRSKNTGGWRRPTLRRGLGAGCLTMTCARRGAGPAAAHALAPGPAHALVAGVGEAVPAARHPPGPRAVRRRRYRPHLRPEERAGAGRQSGESTRRAAAANQAESTAGVWQGGVLGAMGGGKGL
jgi:hypothetical protein